MRSRRICAVSFTLSADEPISIGDPHRSPIPWASPEPRDPHVEMERAWVPVARAPSGDPIVRGTSVMGPLRTHLASYPLLKQHTIWLSDISSRASKNPPVEQQVTLADVLCGSHAEERTSRTSAEPRLRPSAVRVVATYLTDSKESRATRTAIDRRTGAAYATKLFEREQLDHTNVEVVLQIDLGVVGWNLDALKILDVSAADAIHDFVVALNEWAPRVGGRKTAGAGAMRLERLHWGVADPLDLSKLLAATSTIELMRAIAEEPNDAGHPRRPLRVCTSPLASPLWELRRLLVAEDPLLVSPRSVDATENGKVRRNVSRSDSLVRASTWRGVIRSRCEFILRSCKIEACLSSEITCGSCATCALFGWTPGPGSEDSKSGSQALVRFHDSPVQRDTQESSPDFTMDHAPIDRFTGGASDGKLFTRMAHSPGAIVEFAVEQNRADRPVPLWGQDLIALALRDVIEGYVGLGNSTTRGYGTVVLADGQAPLPLPSDRWLQLVPGFEPGATP